MLKHLIPFIAVVLFLLGCSADYDTFGSSDYRDFNDISFVEQDGPASIFPEEHKISINLLPPVDQGKSWDSLTVDDVSVSHMADLHLVESKFKDFPSDSVTLDSLAKVVAFSSEKIKKGTKIKLPKSLNINVVVVSESDISSIWNIAFAIPGVEAEDDVDDPEIPSDPGASGGENNQGTTGDLSADTSLSMAFDGQLRVDVLQSDIVVKFPEGFDLSKAVLSQWSVGEKATIEPSPESVTDWSKPQKFTVVAENGTKKEWNVALSVASVTDVLSISAEKEIGPARINDAAKTIDLFFRNAGDLNSVKINELVLPEGSVSDLAMSGVDLNNPMTFTVSSDDGKFTKDWTLSAQVISLPAIKTIKVGKGSVTGVIDENSGKVFFDMSYLMDTNLVSLVVKELELSNGATADISVGSAYNFAFEKNVVVTNVVGETKTYTLQAGYQYPNSDFNSWSRDDFGNENDVNGWDNGNNDALSSTKLLTVNENKEVVKMESVDAKVLGIGRFASGNMLVAYFNPKNVKTLKLTEYDDGNELIDFGRPFNGRPRYVEFDVKYEGKKDSCDLYVLLENRTRTANEGRNQFRTSTDKNTLVASAWYRSTTVEDTSLPDVVSIENAKRSGYKTIRLEFKYGEPNSGSPIFNSRVFATSLLHSDGINNSLVTTKTPDDFNVTHIRVVMASSAAGNLYKGSVGATLYVDEMRLIY
ncbi:MAG: PCMD domain-containing protein [Fibrobacter sp.]|nr:PCMD domain-containing protein [Fibrobacter sp.]